MTGLPDKDKPNDRRVVTLLLLGLVVLFGGLYVAGYAYAGDKVPRGTTVSGVEVGGLRPAAARAELRRELGPRVRQPVVVSAGGRRTSLDPETAGLAVDYEESVAQAGGDRSWHPSRLWDYFTGGDDLEASLAVDDAALTAAIDGFAAQVDEPAVEGTVTFDNGRAKPRYPEVGRQIDRQAAASAIADALLDPSREVVPLEVVEVEPEVSEDDVRAAMDDFANPALSGPVTLVIGGEDVVVRPRAFSRALSLDAENGALVPHADPQKLLRAIEPAMDRVSLSPKPATVRLVDGAPRVIPGKNGVTFDPEKLAEQFTDLVVQDGAARILEVESVVDRPDFTTKDARALQIKEVVSEFTTYFPHADYRNVNLSRAAELVNGTVLEPGETFSLNDTVGERTAENGFTEGFIISDGVYKEDFGGGVSQVATTLFNAAFFAGLEDVEHKPHSFYIDRYPIGREATVAWGAVDLKFKNDTPYGVLIEAWVVPSNDYSSGEMHVRMWSTKYWDISAGVSDRYDVTKEQTRYIDSPECVPHDGYGGFDIDVYRYFRRAGSDELVRTETMHTTYLPSDTVICRKKRPSDP